MHSVDVTLSPVVETSVHVTQSASTIPSRGYFPRPWYTKFGFPSNAVPPRVVPLGCPMLLTCLRPCAYTLVSLCIPVHRSGTSLALVAYNTARSRITCHQEITRSDFAQYARVHSSRNKLHNVHLPYILHIS